MSGSRIASRPRAAPTWRWWAPCWRATASSGWRRSPRSPRGCAGGGDRAAAGHARGGVGAATSATWRSAWPGGRPERPAEVTRRGADRLGRPGARRGAACSARAAPTPASTCTWRRWRRSPRWPWPRRATRPSRPCAAPSSRSCSRATTSTRPTSSAARARLGCDLTEGAVGALRRPRRAGARPAAGGDLRRAARRARADRGRARVRAAARHVEEARRVANRLGRQALVGLSSHYSDPADVRRALEEAELVLGVTAAGGGPPGRGDRRRHLPAAVPRARHPPRGGAELLRGHDRAAGALRRAVLDRPGRHARGLPGPELQHERHGRGDPRAPPHGRATGSSG